MLLDRLRERRAALMAIGRDAIRKGEEIGIGPSCSDSISDAISESMPRIREVGHEEITRTHAAAQPAYVSDGRGGIIQIDPDGTRHVLQFDDFSPERS